MSKQIIVNVALLPDGSVNAGATDAAYFKLRDELIASVQEDFSTVAIDITTFLLQSPGLRTIPTATLVRNLWEAKAESGALKGKTQAEKQALFERVEAIVPEYVKANKDMFHMGRKTGIAVRYVPGEVQKDKDGNEVFDAAGNTIQALRHNDEEWAKLTTPKDKPATNGVASTETATAAAS